MLHGPGRKLFLETHLCIVLKAVVAQCPKAEPGEEGATDGPKLNAWTHSLDGQMCSLS